MRGQKSNRKAFTLVELLVVIVIISLLAAIFALPSFKQLGKAKRDIAKAKMTIIEGAIGRFYIDCGRFPDDSENLNELLVMSQDVEEKWNGPYLKASELLDPWGGEYIYIAEGEINPGSFDLISLGGDKQDGGEGEDALYPLPHCIGRCSTWNIHFFKTAGRCLSRTS